MSYEARISEIPGKFNGNIGLQVSLSGDLFVVSRVYRVQPKRAPCRGEVRNFSPASQNRLKRYLRECTAEYGVFITLTYPPGYGVDGKACKEDLRRFVQECNRYSRKREFRNGDGKWSMLWFMEFQQNGRLHFHLLSTHRYPKDWVAGTWFRIVGSENESHLKAGTRIESVRGGRDAVRSYVLKYTSKAEQKEIPENFGWVGRFWGVYGWKHTESAVIRIRPTALEDPQVRRRLKNLKTILKNAIADGRIKAFWPVNSHSQVWLVKDKAMKRVLQSWINSMEAKLILLEEEKNYWETLPPEIYGSHEEEIRYALGLYQPAQQEVQA